MFHAAPGSDPRVWVTACALNGTGIDTVGSVSHLDDEFGVTLSLVGDSLTFMPTGLGMGAGWMVLRFAKTSHSDSVAISPLGQARW